MMMTLNEYQERALRTATYPREGQLAVLYPALGLCGEAGETAEKVKKVIRRRGEFDAEARRSIALEAADCLWYVAALAKELGYTLEEVASMNLDKLADRQERGVIEGEGDDR